MIALALWAALLIGGAVHPIDDADQADLDYLRFALTEYEASTGGRRHHTPAGTMDDVHAEHLRMVKEAQTRVTGRRGR